MTLWLSNFRLSRGFRLVSGNHDLFELIASWTFEKVFPDSAHQRLLELLRSYFLIGGMPEAVNHYIEYEDFAEVYSIQESILQTYRDDFSKYAQGSNLIRLQKILDYLGQGLGDKIKYVNIDRDSQARELKTAIDLLAKAGIIFKVKHSHADAIPLNAQLEERVFKLFSLDLGIYNRICELDYIPPSSDWDDRFVNEGKLAEQFIAQHLFLRKSPKQKPELHYWLRNKKSENAEVDFLCSINQNIIPIEVKSGKSGSLKSLQQFVIDKDHKLACRFDLNQPSEQRVSCSLNSSSVDYHLINLPLYMVGQFKRIMENL